MVCTVPTVHYKAVVSILHELYNILAENKITWGDMLPYSQNNFSSCDKRTDYVSLPPLRKKGMGGAEMLNSVNTTFAFLPITSPYSLLQFTHNLQHWPAQWESLQGLHQTGQDVHPPPPVQVRTLPWTYSCDYGNSICVPLTQLYR